jgi:hypothetical protein
MKKNVSGQSIGAQMITIADGSDFTSAVDVVVTKDGGTQTARGGSAPTHKGKGEHNYIPTQAETDAGFITFTFFAAGAITAGIKVYTSFPQTVDNNTILAGLNDIAATDIVSSGAITTSGGAVSTVTTVATTTTNSDMRGTENAATAINLATVDSNVDLILTDTSTTIPATIATIDGNVDAILLDTAEIGVAGAGLTDLGGMSTAMKAEVNVEAGIAISDYDGPTTAQMDARTLIASAYFDPAVDTVANVTTVATTTTNTDMRGTDSAATAAGLAALNDLSSAQVNAEVLDVLTVDTFVEPSSVPSATSSILAKIGWLFTLNRNKVTQTSTTQTLRNDGDISSIATSAVSDDGTTTIRNEYT